MTIADTIRLLARSRMNEAEIMAALGVEREYVRRVHQLPSRKDVRTYRVDSRLAGPSQKMR